jgi:hypothetical protein
MTKRLLLTLFALVICLDVTSCATEINVETGVKNSVYELDGSDMISFYMTSDAKPFGVWDYSLDGNVFETFAETEETKDYGNFGSDQANYRTLILKPTEEGSAKITFILEKTGEKKEFDLTVTKDENGILRIKAE